MGTLGAIGVVAIIVTTLCLLAARSACRASTPRATPGWTAKSVYEAAFLVGGPRRVVDTVITTMHEDQRVQVTPHGRLQVLRPVAANDIEGAVLAACGPEWQADLRQVRDAVMRSSAVQEIGDELAAHGLLHRPDSIRYWRLAAKVQRSTCLITCFAMLATFLMSRPTAHDGGATFAVFCGAIVASIIGQSLAPHGRLTEAGQNAVAQLRRSNPWVPAGTPPRGPAVPALVAIIGVEVLASGPLRDELMASAAGAGGPSDPSHSDPGGAAWCGSSGGGCGGGSGGSSSGGGGCGGGGGG
jgi:uncharacterized protein (TIGR04222 family)